jgi:catechol 2,3-dioxygenase-like lactoylglutathione lyase family enzyme
VITHFDHLTVLVHDVAAAAEAYACVLGRPPSWRGSHPELGRETALFGLGNALIELSGPLSGALEAEGLREHLAAHGEGLAALAFGTQDADACSSELRTRGVRATPPELGEARAADGSMRQYRALELSPRATRGLPVLVVERLDALQLMATGDSAPDRAEALDHVVITTGDAAAALALYGQGLGIRIALDKELFGTRRLFFRVGRVTLEVVQDPALSSQDRFYGAAYRVRDLEATHARLRQAGLHVTDVRSGRKQGTGVFALKDTLFGVPTLIIRDPSRD